MVWHSSIHYTQQLLFFIRCLPACLLPLFLTMLSCLRSLILTSCCHLNGYLPRLLTHAAFIPLLFLRSPSMTDSKKSESKMFCLNIVINIISPRIYENIVWQFETFLNKHIAVLLPKGQTERCSDLLVQRFSHQSNCCGEIAVIAVFLPFSDWIFYQTLCQSTLG